MAQRVGHHLVYPNINMPVVQRDRLTVTAPWHQFLLSLWERTGGTTAPTSVGFIAMWGGLTAPGGWLVCDGAAVSRTSFAELFAAIGTVWGNGDGRSTFNLPNLVGRFLRGDSAAGKTGGSDKVTLGNNNVPVHTHSVTDPGHGHAVTDPGHIHTITDPTHVHPTTVVAGTAAGLTGSGDIAVGDSQPAATGITINS